MKKIIIIAVCSVITACSFHSRDHEPLRPTLSHVYLDASNPYNKLSKNVSHALASNGAEVVASKDQATTVLTIVDDHVSQRISSVSANTQVKEYVLSYTLNYQLSSKDKQNILGTQSVTARRNFTVNANRVLGSNHEQDVMLEEMQADAIVQMINQLASNKTKKALQTAQ